MRKFAFPLARTHIVTSALTSRPFSKLASLLMVWACCLTTSIYAVDSCSVPSFQPAPIYAVGQDSRDVATGDFNGDGKSDIVTANAATNDVSVLINNGAGVFGSTTSFAAGAFPISVAVGDFNNNGKLDIVTANNGATNVSILLGDGAGSFSAPTNVSTGDSPNYVAVGDFNGDHNTDLALANENSGRVAILLGNGTGGFSAPTSIEVGQQPRFLVVGDFNNDNKQDLAVSIIGEIQILIGNGSGGFTRITTPCATTLSSRLAVGDFNRDGNADLVAVYSLNSTVSILLGNGTGCFGTPTRFEAFGGAAGNMHANSVAVGDFNNDTKDDLIVGGDFGAVSVFLGDGAGGFGPPNFFGMRSGVRTPVAIANLNGDGKADIVVLAPDYVIPLLGDGAGNFGVFVGVRALGGVAADFNSDGKSDLAVLQGTVITILFGDGAGGFSSRSVSNFAPRNFSSLAVGDFNGDGKPDLSAINGNNPPSASILLNNGSGGFTSSSNTPIQQSSPIASAVGDFNGDTKQDVVVLHQTSFNSLSLLLGDGAGGLGGPTTFSTPSFSSAYLLGVGDFNNDTRADLALPSVTGVAILLSNGAGGFNPGTNVAAGISTQAVLVRDFNGDGKLDLAAGNQNTGNNDGQKVALIFGDGTGGFSGPTLYNTGGSSMRLVSADFNADGAPDLATLNGAFSPPGNSVTVLLNNGAGVFQTSATYLSGESNLIAAADFNSDSRPDLAVSAVPGNISLLFNTCGAASSTPGTLQFEVGNYSVTEGGGTMSATVTRSTGTSGTVTVNYQTSNGTANAPADYTPVSGTLTFGPGETSKTITVAVAEDALDEANETINLTLTGPAGGAVLGFQNSATLTIIDNDPPPTISISDATVTEGDTGTVNAVFTLSLSVPSGQPVSVTLTTLDGTARSFSDFQTTNPTLTFNPGETTKTLNVAVRGDTTNEPDETFSFVISTASNATVADGQGIGTIINDDRVSVELGQAIFSTPESSGFITINVTRSGDISAPASVKYATSDSTDANFRCDPTTPGQPIGVASRKCDYHIAVGTLRYTAGEATKQLVISIVNDVYVESSESFTLTLSNPVGMTLGQTTTATVTITSDDTAGAANPIDNTSFYVRQLYVDLLSREPDPAGLSGWTTRIDQCGQPGQPPPPCDRVTVGGDGFLRSGEFFDRQFFVIRLYRTGLGRILRYDEVADLAYVSGFLTTEQLELNKQDLVSELVLRDEFANRYNPLSNAAFVATLLQTAGVTVPQSVQDGWVSVLDGGTRTRAQVFREISERPEVSNKYAHEAQVVSAYYGFFTRNPDGAYLNYLQRLDSGEINLSDLANAFINAAEYRSRFGR
jgi:Calx-beta domain/FG-GAP-like repeat